MPLTHELFTGSARLSEAYNNSGRGHLAMSPREEKDATRRVQRALLITEGPRDMKEFFPNGFEKDGTGIYGASMARAVTRFQQRVFRGQIAKHHGRVDHDTLDKLESELRQKEQKLSVMKGDDEKITDLVVYMSGIGNDKNTSGGRIEGELDDEPRELSQVGRPGISHRFLGFQGSLANPQKNVELALDAIERNFQPGGKLILYGFSAGAVQVLQLCERIDLRNVGRVKGDHEPAILVDLLVTIDAAAAEKTPFIKRVVAGCVKKKCQLLSGKWSAVRRPAD